MCNTVSAILTKLIRENKTFLHWSEILKKYFFQDTSFLFRRKRKVSVVFPVVFRVNLASMCVAASNTWFSIYLWC